MSVDVLLVRHAESQANREGRLAHEQWEPDLTPEGRLEAEALSSALAGVQVDALVTSPLRRARQTVAPLARRLGMTPVVLSDLREVGLGAWDGRLLRELSGEVPGEFSAWLADPDASPPPGGEPILAVGRRVLATLGAFCADHPDVRRIVAVSHGDCLKGALMVVVGLSGPSARRITVGNVGAVRFERSPEGAWRLVAWPLQGFS